MMMRALEAGGMDAAHRASRDRLRTRHGDEHYDPNAGGLYELERADYLAPGFPAGYEGRLVKCLRRGPARMAPMPGGIRVVYMLRDPEEVRQSFMAFFGSVPRTATSIGLESERNLALIRRRPDTQLMTLEYEAVLEEPAGSLAAVADHFGVELDVAAAAAVVDPTLRRFRRDQLVPGIV